MMRGKEKFKFLHKILSFILISGSFLLLPVISFAQDQPCGGESSDPLDQATCPLDTYVWILVIAAVIFGAVHLHRQQKMQNQA